MSRRAVWLLLLTAVIWSSGCSRPRRSVAREAIFSRPKGFVEVSVGGVAVTPGGNAVLLVDMARRKMVPILIGDSEAMSIQRRLEQRQAGKNSEARRGLAKPNPSWFERSGVESSPTPPPSGPVRPLTHDLLDSMVTRLGGQIHSVRVERLDHGVFYGIVVLKTRGTLVEFDARSSDAVALAVGNGVPIFMAQSVLDQAGMGLPESPPSPGEESVAL